MGKPCASMKTAAPLVGLSFMSVSGVCVCVLHGCEEPMLIWSTFSGFLWIGWHVALGICVPACTCMCTLLHTCLRTTSVARTLRCTESSVHLWCQVVSRLRANDPPRVLVASLVCIAFCVCMPYMWTECVCRCTGAHERREVGVVGVPSIAAESDRAYEGILRCRWDQVRAQCTARRWERRKRCIFVDMTGAKFITFRASLFHWCGLNC